MHRSAYVLLLLTTVFWGGNAIAGKLAVGHVSPNLLTALRWMVTLTLLAAIGWPRLREDWPKARASLPLLAALGALGFGVFNIAMYTALVHTTAINVSIEQAAIPMVIFLANYLLFRMRVSALQIAGFAMTLAGVVVVATHGEPLQILALDLNRGDAIMLVAVLIYSAYTVALRWKPDIHWQSMMLVMAAAAFLATVPFAAVEFALGAGQIPDARGWAVILYTVLFPSLLSQVFFMRGVEMIGANRAGLFINLVPIFGTILSVLLLGEAFEPFHGVALALVMGGIWMAEASGRRMAG
jgi:drug/metabolite transporter (DMT)-like permease